MQIAIFLQLLWVIGAIFWNLTGFDIAESGEAVPISISFIESIIILLVIGVFLIIFHHFKLRGLFRLVSLSAAVYAGICIYQVFSTDPDLWVNATWQWGGAGIHLFGVITGLAGVFGRTFPRSYRPDPISPLFDKSPRSGK